VNNDEFLLKSRIDAVDPAVVKIEIVRSTQTIYYTLILIENQSFYVNPQGIKILTLIREKEN
jgi:hypothetical protein